MSLIFQVATFFRTKLKYSKLPAYAVVLDKVPGLSSTAKANIRKFLSDKKNGVHNNPRPFSNDELAEKGIVR